jgi:hypothetical protein
MKHVYFLFIAIATLILISFQNCSKTKFEVSEDNDPKVVTKESVDCLFNGKKILNGQSIVAFLTSSVPFGKSCESQDRKCENGVLSGMYEFESCSPGAPHSCLFNGKTIPHGGSVSAYLTSSVGFGSACSEEIRYCNDGHLSGNYSFAACTPGSPASCIFNGNTVQHGRSVKAFQTSSVAFGSTCNIEDRICNNGKLSGTFSFASCNPGAPASCIFNGNTVPHGGSVKAYQTSSVAFGSTCNVEDRMCDNGKLSGSFTFNACSTDPDLGCYLNSVYYAQGTVLKRYKSEVGNPVCEAEQRTCSAGTFTGSFQYSSCEYYEYTFLPIFVVGPCEEWDFVRYPCDESQVGRSYTLNFCGYTNKEFVCQKKKRIMY